MMRLFFYLVTTVLLISNNWAKAQNAGTLVFEQTINLHKSLTGMQKAYKMLIPETITKKYSLLFNDSYGRIKEVVNNEEEEVMISMDGGGSDLWFDFKAQQCHEIIELDGESFYLTKSLKPEKEVSLYGKERIILGFPCKAIAVSEGKYTVWYTELLPGGLTPMMPFVAPGAILSIQGDKISFEAKSFDRSGVADEVLLDLKPKGNAITEQQAADLQEEKRDAIERKGKK